MKQLISVWLIAVLVTSTLFISEATVVAGQQQCTEELKECPDGTNVARNPARNCAFDPCSGEVPACTKDARVCPDGTSQGRDPSNNCMFPACPNEQRGACAQCRQTYDECVNYAQLIEMAPGPERDAAIREIVANCEREYNACQGSCEGTMPAEPTQPRCDNGCYAMGRSNCVPVGTRMLRSEATLEESAEPVYCGVDGTFEAQRNDGEPAQNSYECSSNFQSDGKCVSVSENLNILQKILKWFSKIFGGN